MAAEDAAVPPARLGTKGVVSYAFGDFGFNLYWQSISLYLLFYYTDVVGLSPAIAGLIYMIASIWDGLIDPLIGVAADRTRTRWGSYRPYLLFGAPILAISFILLYYRPPFDGSSLIAFVLLSHLAFRTCYAGVNVPFSALSARITVSATERSQISGFRMIFAMLAGIIVPLTTQPVAAFVGGANGFDAAAAILALGATIIIPFVFLVTREYVPPTSAEPSPSTKIFWGSVLRNRAFWTLIAAATCMVICSTALGKSVLYYFKYYMDQEAAAKTGLALAAASGIVIVPAWMYISRFIGKRGVWFASSAFSIVGLMAFALLDIRSIRLMNVYLVFMQIGTMGLAFCYWSMLPDCVEYGQWRTGVRAEAFIFGLGAFFAKVALGLGAGLFGLSLELVGYHPNEVQTPQTLAGLKFIMVALPLIGICLGALAIYFSPLRRGVHEKIVTQLTKN